MSKFGNTPVEEKGKFGTCPACGCKGPNPGYEPMKMEEIQEEMKTLQPESDWILAPDGKSISRSFVCRNWQAAINTIQAISIIAESKEVQHHPDLHLTNYRELQIVLNTHAAKGLTKYDFTLARMIDTVPIDYSPKWYREHTASLTAVSSST